MVTLEERHGLKGGMNGVSVGAGNLFLELDDDHLVNSLGIYALLCIYITMGYMVVSCPDCPSRKDLLPSCRESGHWTVSSCQFPQSLQRAALPEVTPSWGSLHLVTEQGRGVKIQPFRFKVGQVWWDFSLQSELLIG